MPLTRNAKDSVSDDGHAGGVASTDIEAIVQKAIEAAVDVLKEEFAKLFEDFNTKLSAFEQRLDNIDSDIDTLKNNCVSSTDVTDLSREIEVVRAESRSFMCAANDAEQFSRRNNLRVLGLTLNPTDDGRSVVTSFLRDKFGLHDVSPNDIEAAHPVPVRQRNADSASASHSTSSDPVIVRFRSRELRDKVIRMRRKLKGSRFAIAEDLTALNMQTLNRLRNNPDVVKSWSWNGKLFAVTRSGPGSKVQVKPFQSLR